MSDRQTLDQQLTGMKRTDEREEGWRKEGGKGRSKERKHAKGIGKRGSVGCRCSSTYTNLQVPVHYVMLVNVMDTF